MNSPIKTWLPHVTVAAVVESTTETSTDSQKRYLLVEELINKKLVINQPAGHWEQGESIAEAVKRETLEETSYIVNPVSLIGIYSWTVPEHESDRPTTDTFLRFTFKCDLIRKTDNALDPDINQYLWLTEDEICSSKYKKRSPLVLESLNDFLSGKNYPLNMFSHLD